MKRILKWVGGILGVLLLAAGGYLIYLFTTYYRVPDDQALKVKNQQSTQFKPGQTYTAMTYNIGYGSYPPSYSFFMDGGKYSRAYSKKSVRTSINGVIKTTQAQNPDVAFYQEIDPDGDRSQHVNEVKMVTGAQQQYANVYGQNYDSAYLFYPFTQPIGKAKSGIITLSKAKVDSSRRYSLPVDNDFKKSLIWTELLRQPKPRWRMVNNSSWSTFICQHSHRTSRFSRHSSPSCLNISNKRISKVIM